jgi:hypothetical protein
MKRGFVVFLKRLGAVANWLVVNCQVPTTVSLTPQFLFWAVMNEALLLSLYLRWQRYEVSKVETVLQLVNKFLSVY